MTTSLATDVRRIRLDIGLEPVEVLRRFRGRDRLVALIGDWHHGEALIAFDPVRVLDGHPFDDVDLPAATQSGVFGGGWIGVWGYQLGRLVEELPPPADRPVPQPHARVAFYDRVLRLTDGVWWLEALPTSPPAARHPRQRDLDDTDVLDALAEPAGPAEFSVGTFAMTPSPDAHTASVARALEHIRAGDIFQVNLCARLEAPFAGDPLDLFCAGVEALAPAYAAFVDAPEGAVASFSPELFLRRTGDEVLSSPIKGTAPLDSDPDELTASAKNRAENVMIVDLMRNDLGRVCTPGSVRVPALVRAERHAVWHLVSDVVGHLGPDITDSDLLRATFPPGSVTGAPKVRAMEIAAELEPTAREAYTGAIGHVSAAAGLELNVAIRTFEISGDRVWLGVGGGIVEDSTPEGELAECFVKARPLIEAVGGRLDLAAEAPDETVPPHVAVEARVDRADLSLGIFDTVLVVDGVASDVEAHVARLDSSVRAVYGQTVRAGLEEAVHRKAEGLPGRHRLRIDAVPLGTDVLVRMTARPILDDADAWVLVPRVIVGGLGQHKWTDRRALAQHGRPGSARHDGDVLVLDDDGSVLETGRASVFLVHDDGVHTPPLDGRILPGTARARVIDQLLEAGIPVIQRRLTTDDVARATEVFVTNALRGVVPVASIEGIGSWPAGPLTTSLRSGSGDSATATSLEDADSPLRGVTHARVLFIDNYDSFVYNLVQYVRELGASAEVVRNDAVGVDELVAARERGELTHVIISPGPGTPTDAGISVDVVRRLGPITPTLGVCLGHQAIGEAYGAAIVRAPEVVHGKPSLVHHDGLGVYTGLPSPLVCARYHSLVVDPATVPPALDITARTASGVVMGLRHRSHPVEGVQMHPESILTAHGHDMLARFLGGDD
ncbi:aminodeoxychorismate synthase component I [Aeromicrobium sp.]|uniref:aminodeoxychorismate synthase component I n=1 Tax=Aeromicrobium sp. TaxID=1871063 RepID=UPI003C37D22D